MTMESAAEVGAEAKAGDDPLSTLTVLPPASPLQARRPPVSVPVDQTFTQRVSSEAGDAVCDVCGERNVGGGDVLYARPWKLRVTAPSSPAAGAVSPGRRRRGSGASGASMGSSRSLGLGLGLGLGGCIPGSPGARALTLAPAAYCSQGNHEEFSHRGVMAHAYDFSLPRGTPILAARGGVVVDVASHFGRGALKASFKEKANFVTVRHADGTYARYFHVEKGTVKVETGSEVATGDELAQCGSSGFSHGPHLHFDVVDVNVKETSVLKLLVGAEDEADGIDVQSGFATFSARLDGTGSISADGSADGSANGSADGSANGDGEGDGDGDKDGDGVSAGAGAGESGRVVAPLVMADPHILSKRLRNRAAAKGSVLVTRRGGNTTFAEKTRLALEAGAVGLVIVNNDRAAQQALPLVGAMTAEVPRGGAFDIPVLVVSQNSGKLITDMLRLHAKGQADVSPVRASITRSPHLRAGTEARPGEGAKFCKPVTLPIRFPENLLVPDE